MNNNNNLEIINANINKTFFKFTLPNVLGFISMSSVVLVDGYFVGNYVSGHALAAVNIIIPLVTLVYGTAIMFTIGGTVRIGKYLGEGKIDKASAVFTKVIGVISFISILTTLICLSFPEKISILLRANHEILPYAKVYLQVIAPFFIFQSIEYAFSVITRTDGNPYLASIAVILGAVINFICNYIFILYFNMGIAGAALGTGISFTVSTIILSFHFILKKGSLYFTRKIGALKELIAAAYNGSSELLSEISAGVIAFSFNWIMVEKLGTSGVEAFTAINYAIWAVNMLSYAVADSLVPLISINFGNKNYKRIKKFIFLANSSVVSIGIIMFMLFTFIPDKIIGLFILPEKSPEAFQIALNFIYYTKYAFLFIGLNIVMSAVFTALHKPIQSVLIALLRGILLTTLFILIMPLILQDTGIYLAVPASEICTIIAAYTLWYKNSVTKRVIKA